MQPIHISKVPLNLFLVRNCEAHCLTSSRAYSLRWPWQGNRLSHQVVYSLVQKFTRFRVVSRLIQTFLAFSSQYDGPVTPGGGPRIVDYY